MRKRSKSKKEKQAAMHRNPNNWKGPFYVNVEDSRIFVPKSKPKMGFTINLGNKWSYFMMACIVILLVYLFAR